VPVDEPVLSILAEHVRLYPQVPVTLRGLRLAASQ
jgi:hypothetical protein